MRWTSRIIMGALLAVGSMAYTSAIQASPVSPDLAVFDRQIGDVTGDGVDDVIYLVGKARRDAAADDLNVIVEDGADKTVKRTDCDAITGAAAKLVVSDFNGDGVADVLAVYNTLNRGIGCFAVDFTQASPYMIYMDGAATPAADKVRSGHIVLTQADDKRELRVRPDTTVEIRLEENASTGFSWQLDGYDTSIFDITGRQSYQAAAGAAVGAPGLVAFTLQARGAGRQTAEFAYYRVWEGRDTAIKTFTVTITVVDEGAKTV